MDDLPRLIFCLSPGRCGTRYLVALLNAIPGVHGVHEGEPNFVDYARAARRDPQEAWNFWHCEKLPYIQSFAYGSLECEVYAETSHLFGKGFVKPLLDLGVVPDVIVLTRNHRDVALSYWRRGSIPAKSLRGQRYLLHPEQAEYCPLPRWWAFTDYQLCYWYTLEMQERMLSRAFWIKQVGGKVAYLDFDTLIRRPTSWLKDGLGLPPPDQVAYANLLQLMRSGNLNATPDERRDLVPPGDLDEQEQQVRDAILNAGEATIDIRQKIDIVVLAMETMRKELAMMLMALSQDKRYNITIGTAAANPTSNTRCQICLEFKDNERRPDWLMMIDEDNVPNGDFLKWVDSDYDVISFVSPCWKPATYPESPIVWNAQLDPDLEKFAPTVNNPDVHMYSTILPFDEPVVDVASAGTGVILIHRRVLEHPDFRAPFVDKFNEFGIRIVGHDLNFCARAREAGFRVASVLQSPASHYKAIDLLAVVRLIRSSQG